MAQLDINFLYGTYVPACTHRVDKHFEGYHTLQYMAGGGVDLAIGPSAYALRGRWFWSCFPGPRIRFHALAGHATWEHRYLAFRGPRVGRWTAEGLFPLPPQQPPGNADMAPKFDELLRLAMRTDPWGVRRAVHLLEGILIELAEARAQEPGDSSWLQRVFTALDTPASTVPEYAEIAAEVGMSLTTLRRRFRKVTGLSPHAYLLQNRIAEARKLLAETDRPIKAIAEDLGYRDVFFFSRQFRRFTGVPPALYRRSCQG